MSVESARFRGAVFDLNGTLVDDIRFHYEAWHKLATRLGLPFDEVTFQAMNGLKNEDIFPRLLGRAVAATELEALEREKEETYRALYRPHLALLPGALAFIDHLRARGIKTAIASSAPRENRALVLDGLALWDRFDAVVVAEGLRGKPAPDIFLAAADAIGLEPSACVAFEDAVNGVRAARAAGMRVVSVTTNVPAALLLDAGAEFVTADFVDLPEDLVRHF